MKKILFLLLFSVAILQGCGNKSTEDNAAIIKAQEDSTKQADLAAKKAWLLKASEEKAEQRKLALIERVKLSPTYQDASGRTIYIQTEVAPYYEGGEEEMRKYLNDNLIYPEVAREQNKQGVVFVDFVIDQDGNVREVVASDVVGEDVDQLLKEESVRVVTSMPGWKAGMQQGKAVDASFSIPIRFVLN